ncbi:MAG: cellulose binding domain-containing protein [Myxococcales bacterium]
MRGYATVVALGLLMFGCSAGGEQADEVGQTEESTAALTQSATATLTVTSSWDTGYCVNVTVKNTGANTSNAWTVTLAMASSKYTSGGWGGTYSQYKTTLTINSAANNGAMAPGATANPVPGFCATRPAGTPLPTVTKATANYCGMAYRDNDNDGYGSGSLVYTCDTLNYATRNGDCCDSDYDVFPGQTRYFFGAQRVRHVRLLLRWDGPQAK